MQLRAGVPQVSVRELRDGGTPVKKAHCSNCGADARIVRGDYEFKETGLRDLVLLDIELIKCGKCGNVDPVLSQVDELMHIAAVAILQKPYRLRGEELRFLRKHIDLSQQEFARLLRVSKTTLSKWENNEDPIGVQSDLLARAIVISRDKRLEKRAAEHIRAFEKIADQQKRVRVEVDAEKLAYEYA
jgi:YgiT-type zinc finger domain-containing protein